MVVPNYPTGPPLARNPYIRSPWDPVLLAVYAVWALTAVVSVSFWAHRRAQKRAFLRAAKASEQSSPSHGGFGGLQQQQQQQGKSADAGGAPQAADQSIGDDETASKGNNTTTQCLFYREDAFGRFAFALYIFFLVHLYALAIVFLFDMYWACQFRGPDNMCFFGAFPLTGSLDVNLKIFIVLWHALLLSYGFSLWKRAKLRNWFRIPCTAEEAHHVWLSTPLEEEVLVHERQVSPVVRAVKWLKSRIVKEEAAYHEETVPVSVSEMGSRFYEFQGSRMVLSGTHGAEFKRFHSKVGSSLADMHKAGGGLSEQDAATRLDLLGRNEIPFRAQPVGILLCKEFFAPFYLYQLLMYTMWFFDSFLVIALIVFSVVILAGVIKAMLVRKNQLSLERLTAYVTDVTVLRSGQWVAVPSYELVPGDLIRVRSEWMMPCDAVILHGAAVCNESSLSGEPMPLQKVQAPPETDREYSPKGRCARYTLFSGTTVLQADCPAGEHVTAVVTETGMDTSKGEIISAILYPSRLVFKYTEELPIVLGILLCYAALNFSLSLYLVMHNGTHSPSWVSYWCASLFTVSQVLSPLLPVALVSGQIKAVSRLRRRGVFCLNPDHIPICGKVRVFCFDKTGTLTAEGLDFLGYRPVSVANSGMTTVSGEVISATEGLAGGWGLLGTRALASCHAVSCYNSEFVGNRLEVAMFTATGWTLSEAEHQRAKVASPDGADSVLTLRRFEFDHGRQTMSVVVRFADGSVHAFMKGSYERVGEMAAAVSLPLDYLESAKALALDGCYVLAVAHRELGKDMTDEAVAHMSRDEVERGSHVLGLLAFRNELKPDSAVAIEELRRGDVRALMITGDNAMCGLYIARQAGMVRPKAKVLLAEKPPAPIAKEGKAKGGTVETLNQPIVWKLIDKRESGDAKTEAYSTVQLFEGAVAEGLERGDVELAVSGAAFDELCGSGAIDRLLPYVRIFARMSPEQKVEVVRLHQAKGLVVGMCGDGGNDCGALRVAHAGIALSDAEASAVSSFTSQSKSCCSVVDLLKEGRAALHNNFSAYKFLITYGQLFSLMKAVVFAKGVIPPRMFYISTDVVAVLLLTWAMNFSSPQPHLAPERPTSSLLGANTLASVLGLHAINTVTFVSVVAMVFAHPDFVHWPSNLSDWSLNWTLADNWEATAASVPTYILFISSSVIFSFGYKFRRPVYTNVPLMMTWLTLMGVQTYLLLSKPNTFTDLWHFASRAFNSPGTTSVPWKRYQQEGGAPSPGMPFELRLRILVLTLMGVVAGAMWQSLAVNGPLRRFCATRFPGNRPRVLL